MTNIGSRLKHFRQKLGLSQLELSQRSGISQASIARIESNKQKNLTADTLERLAAALEVPAGHLLEEPVLVKEEKAAYQTARMLPVVKLERFIALKGHLSQKDKSDLSDPSHSTDPKAFFLMTSGAFAGAVSARSVLLLVEPSVPVSEGDAALLLSHEVQTAGRVLSRQPFFLLQPFRQGAEPIVFDEKKRKRKAIRLFRIAEIREKY